MATKEKNKKRLTMNDIAKMAGVDPSTVSRALADSPRLPRKTKDKIRKIVKDTGFVANRQARVLRSQRSGQILVMHNDVASLSFPEYAQGIEEAATELGMSVLVGSAKQDDEREEALGRLLLSGAVDGAIILSGRLPHCIHRQSDYERSVVSVSQPLPDTDIACVSVNVANATQSAIEHLLSLSHKNIAIIAGPANTASSIAHVTAFEDVMSTAGLSQHCIVENVGGSNIEAGTKGMTRILAGGHRPTAVFCITDELAIGAMNKAQQAGFSVPDAISFVGYNDLAIARAMDPALTSVRTPLRQMGRIGAEMLIENLDSSRAKPESRTLDHELVVRDSCGPAPNR